MGSFRRNEIFVGCPSEKFPRSVGTVSTWAIQMPFLRNGAGCYSEHLQRCRSYGTIFNVGQRLKHIFRINIVVCLLLSVVVLPAQNNAHKDLRKADKAYQDKNFSDAEVGYRRALEKDNSTKGNYNLGNSTYRQERYDESIKHYQAAAEAAKDRTTKARAFHNLGNALYQKGDFKQSIEAYKNALRQNPNDLDTKRNLTNALRRLPPPPPQQQNQQNQQGGGEKKKDDQQQPPQDQQQPNPGEENQDQKEEEKQDQSQEQKSSGQKEQPQDLSKQEAKELLEIMDQEEQKVQQKLKKAQAKKGRSAKDW